MLATLGRDGAFVDEATPTTTTCTSARRSPVTFANGDDGARSRSRASSTRRPAARRSARSRSRPTAWDAENPQPKNLYSFVQMEGGETDANAAALEQALAAFPNAKVADARGVHRQPDLGPQLDPQHPLRAARAVGDRQPVRDRQHAGADGVRADARDRDAARDRDDAPAGAADDPPRERDHRADRRRRSGSCSGSSSAALLDRARRLHRLRVPDRAGHHLRDRGGRSSGSWRRSSRRGARRS